MKGEGLEGFILGSYLETFRRAVWGGGLEGFILGGTRGFYIRFLFRNLGGGLDGLVEGTFPLKTLTFQLLKLGKLKG